MQTNKYTCTTFIGLYDAHHNTSKHKQIPCKECIDIGWSLEWSLWCYTWNNHAAKKRETIHGKYGGSVLLVEVQMIYE